MSTSEKATSVFAAMRGRWLIEFTPKGQNQWRPCYSTQLAGFYHERPLIVTTLAQGLTDIGYYNQRNGASYRCIATTETDEEIIERSQLSR